MSVFDRAMRTWRTKRQRGVSPIIATILLVAITVVLAAVLYVLISGLTHGGGSVPYSISMGSPSWSSTNPDYGTITISGSSGGLTTALFGLSISTLSGSPVAVGTAAPATCKWVKAGTPYSTTNCGAGTGNWYVVLFYTGNGSIADVYVAGAWASGTPTVAINAGAETLVVIGTESLLQSSGDTLNAFGTGSSSVSGSSGSF
jgi:flagellin-like protein